LSGHSDRVLAEFSKQAPSFEDPDYSFGDPRLLRWILDHVPVEGDSLVLDVAGGTGHLARALATGVRQVVVLDLTAAMLEEGKRQAEALKLPNVLFERGDAAAMPYLDHSFDLVVSRFAVHHFESPAVQLREMARVCRPGGKVAVVDLVTVDPAQADDHNRLERLRDPSHARALSAAELTSLLEAAGLRVVHETAHDQALDVERWLRQSDAPHEAATQIRQELRDELDGGPATGMRPRLEDDCIDLTQRWTIAVGEKIKP
jgi:ubiquinone/menaquinone biosynthesis C-methylase UbiE